MSRGPFHFFMPFVTPPNDDDDEMPPLEPISDADGGAFTAPHTASQTNSNVNDNSVISGAENDDSFDGMPLLEPIPVLPLSAPPYGGEIEGNRITEAGTSPQRAATTTQGHDANDDMPPLLAVSDSSDDGWEDDDDDEQDDSERDDQDVEMMYALEPVDDDNDSDWMDEDDNLPPLEPISGPVPSDHIQNNRRARVDEDDEDEAARPNTARRSSVNATPGGRNRTPHAPHHGIPPFRVTHQWTAQGQDIPPNLRMLFPNLVNRAAAAHAQAQAQVHAQAQAQAQAQTPQAQTPQAHIGTPQHHHPHPPQLFPNPNPQAFPTLHPFFQPGQDGFVFPQQFPAGPGAPPADGPFFNFANLLGAFGLADGWLNPQEEKDDPERAKKLLAGLEVVPTGLVRRLERVGGAPGGHIDGSDTGGAGTDVPGCAVCWDNLLDREGEGFEEPRAASEPKEAVSSADATDTASPSSTPSMDVDDTSSSSALINDQSGTDANQSLSSSPEIIVLPCSHVFHASCLLPWFSRPRAKTCPTCRFDIDPENLVRPTPRPRQANPPNSATAPGPTTAPSVPVSVPAPPPQETTEQTTEQPAGPGPHPFPAFNWTPFVVAPIAPQQAVQPSEQPPQQIPDQAPQQIPDSVPGDPQGHNDEQPHPPLGPPPGHMHFQPMHVTFDIVLGPAFGPGAGDPNMPPPNFTPLNFPPGVEQNGEAFFAAAGPFDVNGDNTEAINAFFNNLGIPAPHIHGAGRGRGSRGRGTREKKQWAPPAATGPTLRQRVEQKEREAGLRCSDVSCGIGPSDDDPFPLTDPAATKQLHIRTHKTSVEAKSVCAHSFHPACLVSAERVAGWGGEDKVDEEVEVSCPVCRAVGCVERDEWELGARELVV